MNEQIESRFSNREEREQIGGYRRFNAVAMLSLLLGLASAVALLAPNAWIVPILAVGFGMIGLWLARRNDDMGGALPAWIGIALALFFLSWAASRLYFQRQVIYSEAEAVARMWFNLVASGEDEMAHQAMLHPTARQPSGSSVDAYYSKDEKATIDKDTIFGRLPASHFFEAGTDTKVTLVENVTQDVDLTYAVLIRQIYRITPPGKEPVDALMSFTRSHKEDLGRATWIVANIEDPDESK